MAHSLCTTSPESPGCGDAFICTECGEGFGQYPKLINHMTLHGSFDSFPFNESSNVKGSDPSVEFALHENGTLTVVDKSALSNFSFLFGKHLNLPQSQSPCQESSTKSSDKEHVDCRCHRCGQAFRSQRNLQQHQQYCLFEQEFRCTLCCRNFHDRQGLREHLQDHIHERFYSCGHCGKRFLRQETLHLHQKERHGPLGSNARKPENNQEVNSEKSYPCKKCGLRFFWLSDLQSHLINHVQINARQQSNEKQHGNSADKQYRCGICGDCFLKLSDLKEHHLSHQENDEENDKEKSTTEPPPGIKRNTFNGKTHPVPSNNLMEWTDQPKSKRRGRPLRGNSNYSRVFPCKQCHRVFVHSSSLSRHMRYHKGTLHTCAYCGRHFPQRCDVTRHVALYHGLALTEHQPKIEDNTKEKGTETQEKMADVDSHDQGNVEQTNQLSPDSKEMSPHKPRAIYKCRDCFRVFGLLSVYQRHVRYHKREPARHLYRCPHCPSMFSFRSALERHLKDHSGDNVKKGNLTVDSNADSLVPEEEETEDEDNGSGPDKNDTKLTSVLYECTECTSTFSCLQTFLHHQSAHGSDNFELH